MALLQIAEPGQSSAPHEHKLAAGIDLGTTNSLVASVRSGNATTLTDSDGRSILPSVVSYSGEQPVIGEVAKQRAELEPENTVISVKRMIGRSLADIQTRYPSLPYRFKASDNGQPILQTSLGDKNPIQVSADILRELAQRAEQTLGGELAGVVITVPAYFDDAQRAGTKDAAKLAGLHVLRLLNEPTAAAIAYGLDSGQEGVIAVYDLGGGTFDISILRLSKGVFEVLATGGDSALGGDDFDHLVADFILAQMDKAQPLTAEQHRALLNAATEAKIALSQQESVSIDVLGWQGQLT
ncbi:Hsp70 family protein, partial [Vibrio sp.]|uniref:Hsp70 family protein n=1 Tax=Vibrio sp. TaxID=678 RepID=UPI003D0FDD60